MHEARSSRTATMASIRAVSRSCHRLDIRDQSRLVGGWSTGRVARASPDLRQGEPEALTGTYHGDAAQRVPLEAPLVARRAHRGDEPTLLVQAHRRHRHPGAVGHLADRRAGRVGPPPATAVALTSSALEVAGWAHDDSGDDPRPPPPPRPREEREEHEAPVRLLSWANLPVVVGIVALVTLAPSRTAP